MDIPCYCHLLLSPRCRIFLVSLPPLLNNSIDSYGSSSPIPEITDADMEFQAETTHANTAIKPFWQQYRLFHAAFAQFCYVGSQVAIAGRFPMFLRCSRCLTKVGYFINYATETRRNTDSALGATVPCWRSRCFRFRPLCWRFYHEVYPTSLGIPGLPHLLYYLHRTIDHTRSERRNSDALCDAVL